MALSLQSRCVTLPTSRLKCLIRGCLLWSATIPVIREPVKLSAGLKTTKLAFQRSRANRRGGHRNSLCGLITSAKQETQTRMHIFGFPRPTAAEDCLSCDSAKTDVFPRGSYTSHNQVKDVESSLCLTWHNHRLGNLLLQSVLIMTPVVPSRDVESTFIQESTTTKIGDGPYYTKSARERNISLR